MPAAIAALCALRAMPGPTGAALLSLLGAVAPAPLLRAVFRLESFSGFVGFWNFFTISKIPLSISVLES